MQPFPIRSASMMRQRIYLLHLFMALICLMCALPVQAKESDALEEARALIDADRSQEAVRMLEHSVEVDADDYHAWFLLGVAHSRQRQFHQAIEAFHKVSELRPDLAEPHNNLAVIYNELGDVRAAVRELEVSLEKKPDYATAQENIADLHIKLALQYYKKALEQSPNESLTKRYQRLLRVRDPGAPAPIMATEEAKTVPADTAAISTEQLVKNPSTENVAEAVVSSRQPDIQEATQDGIESEQATQAEDIEAARTAVEAWRMAWSDRDIDGYVAVYADDFYPRKKFASRDDWLRYKRRVITGKQFIRVTLEHVQSEVLEPGKRVRMRFLQHFVSNNYNSDDRKELVIERKNNSWKIVRESSW